MPFPPTVFLRVVDSFGHHCAACARVGVLGTRGHVLESMLHEHAGKREVVSRLTCLSQLDLVGIQLAGERKKKWLLMALPGEEWT